MMALFLCLIVLVGISGALAFLKSEDRVESGSGLSAHDFEITEITE